MLQNLKGYHRSITLIKILIFSVFKIASCSRYWLQIKFSISLFFYLFTFAINFLSVCQSVCLSVCGSIYRPCGGVSWARSCHLPSKTRPQVVAVYVLSLRPSVQLCELVPPPPWSSLLETSWASSDNCTMSHHQDVSSIMTSDVHDGHKVTTACSLPQCNAPLVHLVICWSNNSTVSQSATFVSSQSTRLTLSCVTVSKKTVSLWNTRESQPLNFTSHTHTRTHTNRTMSETLVTTGKFS